MPKNSYLLVLDMFSSQKWDTKVIGLKRLMLWQSPSNPTETQKALAFIFAHALVTRTQARTRGAAQFWRGCGLLTNLRSYKKKSSKMLCVCLKPMICAAQIVLCCCFGQCGGQKFTGLACTIFGFSSCNLQNKINCVR